VNPVVAMFLGWLFAGEKLTGRSLLAAAVILAGVVLITSQKKLKRRAADKLET
jgi:drug/metabolite transporter (DMT)-like permease